MNRALCDRRGTTEADIRPSHTRRQIYVTINLQIVPCGRIKEPLGTFTAANHDHKTNRKDKLAKFQKKRECSGSMDTTAGRKANSRVIHRQLRERKNGMISASFVAEAKSHIPFLSDRMM